METPHPSPQFEAGSLAPIERSRLFYIEADLIFDDQPAGRDHRTRVAVTVLGRDVLDASEKLVEHLTRYGWLCPEPPMVPEPLMPLLSAVSGVYVQPRPLVPVFTGDGGEGGEEVREIDPDDDEAMEAFEKALRDGGAFGGPEMQTLTFAPVGRAGHPPHTDPYQAVARPVRTTRIALVVPIAEVSLP